MNGLRLAFYAIAKFQSCSEFFLKNIFVIVRLCEDGELLDKIYQGIKGEGPLLLPLILHIFLVVF